MSTQLLHAVGVAHAAKFKGEDTVVLAMCGEGATKEGDFHEALNFAAVFQRQCFNVLKHPLFGFRGPALRLVPRTANAVWCSKGRISFGSCCVPVGFYGKDEDIVYEIYQNNALFSSPPLANGLKAWLNAAVTAPVSK